ncbi:hypothetical protein KBD20_03375 [Candidatus Saccharibacteria bacterium]|nr:hypothetical protein [Candidatus Saccharibacteria bacterium]
MERSRHERGGQLRLVMYGAGALCIAAVAEVGVLILSKNKRTPQQRGGWEYIDFSEDDNLDIRQKNNEFPS